MRVYTVLHVALRDAFSCWSRALEVRKQAVGSGLNFSSLLNWQRLNPLPKFGILLAGCSPLSQFSTLEPPTAAVLLDFSLHQGGTQGKHKESRMWDAFAGILQGKLEKCEFCVFNRKVAVFCDPGAGL